MSIVRPSPQDMTRRMIVIGTAAFAVFAGAVQGFSNPGQSPAEFAADSDATLKVASYAFAIWGPIYLGLLIYAVRQALPQTGESDMIHRFGLPSALAFLGIGAWIFAAAFDWEVATIILIFGSLAALLVPLLADAGAIRALPRKDRDRWMTVWPLSLLAGWLSIAAPVNLLTVATGNGDLPAVLPLTVWAMLAIVVVVLFALFMTRQLRIVAFALPVAWGLLGAFVAEQEKGNQLLSLFALAAAVATLIGAVVLAFRLPSGGDRSIARDHADGEADTTPSNG